MRPALNSQPTLVLLHTVVTDMLDRVAMSCEGENEIGGILLGCQRGPHVEIVDLTSVGPGDLSSRYRFVRQDPVHQRQASKAWAASGETVTFMGEWHSHPAGSIQPSSIDRQTWRELVVRNRHSMCFLLASPEGWGVFFSQPTLLGPSIVRLGLIETGQFGQTFGEQKPSSREDPSGA